MILVERLQRDSLHNASNFPLRILDSGNAINKLDDLILPIPTARFEIRRLQSDRRFVNFREAGPNGHPEILDRHRLDQIRIRIEQIIGVSDWEYRRDEFDLDLLSELLQSLDMLKIPFGHFTEPTELRVGDQTMSVARLCRSLQ